MYRTCAGAAHICLFACAWHRYLKPESILFYRADSDQHKVIVFGLSKAILEDTGDFLKSRIEISNYFAAKVLRNN